MSERIKEFTNITKSNCNWTYVPVIGDSRERRLLHNDHCPNQSSWVVEQEIVVWCWQTELWHWWGIRTYNWEPFPATFRCRPLVLWERLRTLSTRRRYWCESIRAGSTLRWVVVFGYPIPPYHPLTGPAKSSQLFTTSFDRFSPQLGTLLPIATPSPPTTAAPQQHRPDIQASNLLTNGQDFEDGPTVRHRASRENL